MKSLGLQEKIRLLQQSDVNQAQLQEILIDILEKKDVGKRNPRDIQLICLGLQQIDFFKKLIEVKGEDALRMCATHLGIEHHSSGKDVIIHGEKGDKFYIIFSGIVEVHVPTSAGTYLKVAEMKSGQSFGELALINDSPRRATIRAQTDCDLAILSKKDYLKIIADMEEREIKKKIDFLENVSFFNRADRRALHEYIYYFKIVNFQWKEVVYNIEEEAKFVYVIRQGEFAISKAKKGNPHQSSGCNNWSRGDIRRNGLPAPERKKEDFQSHLQLLDFRGLRYLQHFMDRIMDNHVLRDKSFITNYVEKKLKWEKQRINEIEAAKQRTQGDPSTTSTATLMKHQPARPRISSVATQQFQHGSQHQIEPPSANPMLLNSSYKSLRPSSQESSQIRPSSASLNLNFMHVINAASVVAPSTPALSAIQNQKLQHANHRDSTRILKQETTYIQPRSHSPPINQSHYSTDKSQFQKQQQQQNISPSPISTPLTHPTVSSATTQPMSTVVVVPTTQILQLNKLQQHRQQSSEKEKTFVTMDSSDSQGGQIGVKHVTMQNQFSLGQPMIIENKTENLFVDIRNLTGNTAIPPTNASVVTTTTAQQYSRARPSSGFSQHSKVKAVRASSAAVSKGMRQYLNSDDEFYSTSNCGGAAGNSQKNTLDEQSDSPIHPSQQRASSSLQNNQQQQQHILQSDPKQSRIQSMKQILSKTFHWHTPQTTPGGTGGGVKSRRQTKKCSRPTTAQTGNRLNLSVNVTSSSHSNMQQQSQSSSTVANHNNLINSINNHLNRYETGKTTASTASGAVAPNGSNNLAQKSSKLLSITKLESEDIKRNKGSGITITANSTMTTTPNTASTYCNNSSGSTNSNVGMANSSQQSGLDKMEQLNRIKLEICKEQKILIQPNSPVNIGLFEEFKLPRYMSNKIKNLCAAVSSSSNSSSLSQSKQQSTKQLASNLNSNNISLNHYQQHAHHTEQSHIPRKRSTSIPIHATNDLRSLDSEDPRNYRNHSPSNNYHSPSKYYRYNEQQQQQQQHQFQQQVRTEGHHGNYLMQQHQSNLESLESNSSSGNNERIKGMINRIKMIDQQQYLIHSSSQDQFTLATNYRPTGTTTITGHPSAYLMSPRGSVDITQNKITTSDQQQYNSNVTLLAKVSDYQFYSQNASHQNNNNSYQLSNSNSYGNSVSAGKTNNVNNSYQRSQSYSTSQYLKISPSDSEYVNHNMPTIQNRNRYQVFKHKSRVNMNSASASKAVSSILSSPSAAKATTASAQSNLQKKIVHVRIQERISENDYSSVNRW